MVFSDWCSKMRASINLIMMCSTARYMQSIYRMLKTEAYSVKVFVLFCLCLLLQVFGWCTVIWRFISWRAWLWSFTRERTSFQGFQRISPTTVAPSHTSQVILLAIVMLVLLLTFCMPYTSRSTKGQKKGVATKNTVYKVMSSKKRYKGLAAAKP